MDERHLDTTPLARIAARRRALRGALVALTAAASLGVAPAAVLAADTAGAQSPDQQSVAAPVTEQPPSSWR